MSGILKTVQYISGKNVTHTFTDWGRFNVKLTVKNNSFMSSSVSKSIFVELNTSANEEAMNLLRIYPNPFTDELWMNMSGKAEITVHNLLGQKIYSNSEFADEVFLNTSSWEKGIYILSVHQNGKSQIRKTIRQ
jgi:PKD repeat protein